MICFRLSVRSLSKPGSQNKTPPLHWLRLLHVICIFDQYLRTLVAQPRLACRWHKALSPLSRLSLPSPKPFPPIPYPYPSVPLPSFHLLPQIQLGDMRSVITLRAGLERSPSVYRFGCILETKRTKTDSLSW